MSRLVLIGIMVFAACGAWAEVTRKDTPLSSGDLFVKQSMCKGVGNIAAAIMKERQRQVPMSEMISRMQQADAMGMFEGKSLSMNAVLGLITFAYKQRAVWDEESQAAKVAGFRNEVELLCYEGALAPAP